MSEPTTVLVVDDEPGYAGLVGRMLERVRAAEPTLPFVLFTGRGSESLAGEATVADLPLPRPDGRAEARLVGVRPQL